MFDFSFQYKVLLDEWFCVLLCLCCVLSNPSRSWQMGAYSEPGSGFTGDFFPLKESFPLHCCYMNAQYEALLQSQCKPLSTVSTCSSRSSECCKSLTQCNLLGFLR
ncbi:hypothetical protein ATANTOWER_032595 [Ataeniobius toweri]|uniref:Secreted protein n=1 Tax=Ataeniobius toweri TaxID=208326 RepID=A0ABU7CMC0_9TELE|nr:hypothetical protein [Ataeniobius toweri]